MEAMDEHTASEQAYKRGLEDGKPKWIPVTERLPEVATRHKTYRNTFTKSVRVLCVCVQKDGKTMVKEGYCEFWDDYPEPYWKIPGTIDSVTHWMPLPSPPSTEELE